MSNSIETVESSQPSPSEPSVEWGLEKLAQFVRKLGGEEGHLEAQSLQIGSKILRLHYDRGKALVLIRDEVLEKKRQAWARFRKQNGFVGTTFDDDIRLYESAISWEEISGMGLTEARIYLGVTKPKVRKPKEAEAAPVAQPTSTNVAQTKAANEAPAAPAITTSVSGKKKDQPTTPPTTSPATPPAPVSGSKDSADSPLSPEDVLLLTVRRLEELECQVQGRVSEAALPLIDQAIEVLGRLRGVAARKAA